ncbi:uncharacterized protein YlbG (UPF0298 family) [Pullulanibacillus pueri]|uniref:UPF0298 protein GCM10007096_02620 n=1 Tax=Pullulanibacillus pueri TaxID=1437324 RepID=A0A8J3EKY6_9BACL|nr:YlbG family protein [Pullulanibacillus pueri]MBM7680111.1 uncharacterized protein YlbG (UPF0298 family) [Pullulanibacillus pueri]GGH74413.1 UPF0298 protein [Pullulanibacillus pueri]
MVTERTGMIVWLYHIKHVKTLRKYGNIHYVSKALKYAVLYCDAEESDLIIQRLKKQKFTKRVDLSYLQEIRTHYKKKTETKPEDEEQQIPSP